MENKFASTQIYAYSLIALLWILLLPATAQVHTDIESEGKEISKKALKHFYKAEQALLINNLEVAEKEVSKLLAIEKDFAEAWLILAEIKLETNKPQEAIYAYRKLISIDSINYPIAFATLGKLYYEHAVYDSSAYYYKQALAHKSIKEEARNLLNNRLHTSITATEIINNPFDVILENIGSTINTNADEYINSLRLDGRELLFTRKTAIDPKKNIYEEGFFISSFDTPSNSWEKAIPFQPEWEGMGNMGALSLSADGKTLLLTGCGWNSGMGSCDIYISNLNHGIWSPPKNIGTQINSSAWEAQPTLSADGNTLLFVSNRSGGIGGSDIYMSVKLENGEWSKAVNLGETINTTGNEMAPFLHPDGKTLYFSSDGHPGLGGMDLFVSKRDETGRWTKPINLGSPINSKEDEINILVTTEGNKAYLSAKKENNIENYDIYSFDLPEIFQPENVSYLRALVTDKESGISLAAAYKLFDIDSYNALVQSGTLNEDGLLLLPLPANRQYALHVRMDGYLFHSLNFKPEFKKAKYYDVQIALEPIKAGKTVALNNVFFELNKAVLQASSFYELNEIVAFLKVNHSLQIELGGHTDNTGSETHNLKLSEDRAKAVKNYLIDKGISQSRIAVKAYGSSKPVADNNTEEGRQQNRRTSFTILP